MSEETKSKKPNNSQVKKSNIPTDLTNQIENDDRILPIKGDKCIIYFKPCCHKMEYHLSKGRVNIHFNHTTFDENKIIQKFRLPRLKTSEHFPITVCPYCQAKISVIKDVSEMITYYGKGLTFKNEDTKIKTEIKKETKTS